MRLVLRVSGILCGVMFSALLTACGQSGALQLPSDPNYDQRAQYLLYKHPKTNAKAQSEADAGEAPASRVSTQP